MSRKAKFIGFREFETNLKKKLLKPSEWDAARDEWLAPYKLSNKVAKDLAKVEFDWENHNFLKIEQLDDGFPVAWFSAGGDWEWGVHFIIYWDGKEFRGYIPKHKTNYNLKYKVSHGSDYDLDSDFDAMREDILDRIKLEL